MIQTQLNLKFNITLLFLLFAMIVPSPCLAEQLFLETVGVNQKTFAPEEDEELVFHFKPNRPAKFRLTIFDRLGEVVREYNSPDKIESEQKIIWDGKNKDDEYPPSGIYYFTIKLNDEDTDWIYNPYAMTHGVVVKNATAYYDEEKKEIKLSLPQASMVRIRVNIKNGGPIITTPLDWTPLAAGEHTIPWDGYDSNGVFHAAYHPHRRMMLYTYNLADNSIILKSNNTVQDEIFAPLNSQQLAKQPFAINLPSDRHRHARKDPRLSRVARMSIDFLEAQKNPDGLPILTDKTPVKVTIDHRDQWILENSRYEIMFFVDGVVLFEDESAFAPFTYIFNTKDISEGEHILTVNILSYDDEYATLSRKFYNTNDDNK